MIWQLFHFWHICKCVLYDNQNLPYFPCHGLFTVLHVAPDRKGEVRYTSVGINMYFIYVIIVRKIKSEWEKSACDNGEVILYLRSFCKSTSDLFVKEYRKMCTSWGQFIDRVFSPAFLALFHLHWFLSRDWNEFFHDECIQSSEKLVAAKPQCSLLMIGVSGDCLLQESRMVLPLPQRVLLRAGVRHCHCVHEEKFAVTWWQCYK